jgi:hypothetical protein
MDEKLDQIQSLNQLFVFEYVSSLRREYVPIERIEGVEQSAVVETKTQFTHVYGNQFEGDVIIHFRGDYLGKCVQHIPLPLKFHAMKISLIFSRGFLEKVLSQPYWTYLVPKCCYERNPTKTFIEFIQSIQCKGGDVNVQLDAHDSWEIQESILSLQKNFQTAEHGLVLNFQTKQMKDEIKSSKLKFMLVSLEKEKKCKKDLSAEHISAERVDWDEDCVLIDFSENKLNEG